MLGPGESAPSVTLLQLDGGDELHLEGDGPHVLAFLRMGRMRRRRLLIAIA